MPYLTGTAPFAVMLAALGVFGTGSAWPDLAVAIVMAVLALTSAASVVRLSWREIERAQAVPATIAKC